MRPFISIQWNSWNSVSSSDSKFGYFQIFPNASLFFIFWYEKFLSINVKNVSLKKWCKNSYFLNWNFVRKSCFVVFFLEWNVWKNPQFNFSGQNLSLERNFFKWDDTIKLFDAKYRVCKMDLRYFKVLRHKSLLKCINLLYFRKSKSQECKYIVGFLEFHLLDTLYIISLNINIDLFLKSTIFSFFYIV